MQACGDVMIGHHGRSVHEAIPHICGAKAIPTSLLVFYHHLELNSQSIKKKTVEQSFYIFHDSLISRDPHLFTLSLSSVLSMQFVNQAGNDADVAVK